MIKIAGISLITLVLVIVLKNTKREFAFILTLCSSILLFGIVVNQMVNLEYHRYSNANHQDILQREIHKSSEQVQAINNNTSHLKTIANRQKILSLNASIEAARSGEAGVGFAVVAKSMQDLSSQSAVIYKEKKKSVAEITETISVLSSLN